MVSALIAAPMPAYAASQVQVGEGVYTEAASGSGSEGGSWSWDGANDMALVNYKGDNIAATGDLTVTTSGDNTIVSENVNGVNVTDGDLTITGDGTLNVETENAKGIYATDGNVNIEDTTVNVSVTNDENLSTYQYLEGIEANSVDISGSNVTVSSTATGGKAWASGISADGSAENSEGNINITDSTVTVNASADIWNSWGIYSHAENSAEASTAGKSGVTVVDSTLTVNTTSESGMALAISAWGTNYDASTAREAVIDIKDSTLNVTASAVNDSGFGLQAYSYGDVALNIILNNVTGSINVGSSGVAVWVVNDEAGVGTRAITLINTDLGGGVAIADTENRYTVLAATDANGNVLYDEYGPVPVTSVTMTGGSTAAGQAVSESVVTTVAKTIAAATPQTGDAGAIITGAMCLIVAAGLSLATLRRKAL